MAETDEDKVVFDDRQQAKVNELIQEAMGRAAKDVRTELDQVKSSLSTKEAELSKAISDLREATKPGKKEGKEDFEALQGRIAELTTAHEARNAEMQRLTSQLQAKDKEILDARSEAINDRKQATLVSAATEAKFFSPDQAAVLTSRFVQWSADKQRFIVVNDAGVERINQATFEPMSLGEFFTEFASHNPWMVKGDVKPGVGSTSGSRADLSSNGKYRLDQIFGPKSDSRIAHEVGKNPAEYARLKAQAKQAGLIV